MAFKKSVRILKTYLPVYLKYRAHLQEFIILFYGHLFSNYRILNLGGSAFKKRKMGFSTPIKWLLKITGLFMGLYFLFTAIF